MENLDALFRALTILVYVVVIAILFYVLRDVFYLLPHLY